ncbi:transposase [Streptomyces goshikiensis]|uniref:transposase n=1 Tax=Streptomyces goshikiensis TaxID=1942 RepID=UPI0036537FC4
MAAGDNPERLRSEASFAVLCGVSPVEASSGKTQRRCLHHRAGRLRWDTRTRGYIDRRVSEGKTRRETLRCLKRYIAREVHQLITRTTTHVLAG